eukprot:498869_1
MSSLIVLLYYLSFLTESNILCDINHKTKCIIHCNMASSCSNMTIHLNQSTTYEFNCNGDYSCQMLTIYETDETNNINISMLCNGPNSCHSLLIYTPNNNINNSNQLVINTFDSCSPIGAGILCMDETSKCNIFCTKKHIEIHSESFTFITQTDQCINKQFSTSCNKYSQIDYIHSCKEESITNIIHFDQWNIQKHSIPNGCLTSYYLLSYRQYICYPNIQCIINCQLIICNSSTIDATKALSFDLICIQNTNCSNMNIYLYNSSSNINIHSQAQNVNLFYADIFPQIINTTSTYSPTTLSPTTPTYSPTTLSPTIYHNWYTPTEYSPTTLAPTLSFLASSMNWNIYLVSLIVASIAYFTIFIAIAYLIYSFILYIYKTYNKQFISNKPNLFVYYFSACGDIIILFGMYWFVIKAWITFNPFNQMDNYCDNKYWDEFEDIHMNKCNNDILCVWDTYECKYSDGIAALYVMWTMYAVIHFLMDIFRYCNGLYLYKGKNEYYGYWGRCHSDFCLCCFTKGINGPSSKKYLNRTYWTDMDCVGCNFGACEINTTWCGYVLDQIVNYGILILFSWIYTELIEVIIYNNTHAIDFYSIIILIIIKIILQILYTLGNTYDAESEIKQKKRIEFMKEDKIRMNILINIFGNHTSHIIKQYLPFYYSDECPKELLLRNKNSIELTTTKQKRKKTKKKKKKKSGKKAYTSLELDDH